MQKMYKNLIISFPFILSSCFLSVKQNTTNHIPSTDSSTYKLNIHARDYIRQVTESKNNLRSEQSVLQNKNKPFDNQLMDVSLPLDAVVRAQYANEGTIELEFQSQVSIIEFVQFFLQTMELYGWQESARVSGQKNYLVFIKPSRTCLIEYYQSTKSFWQKKQKIVAHLILAKNSIKN